MNFKQFFSEEKEEVISFDFDDTIALSQWDHENNDYLRDENNDIVQKPNKRIIDLIKDYKNKGYKVIVVTTRYDKWRQETEDQLKEWGVPIDEVHFTNGAWKANRLKKLGVFLHYDDDHEELRRLKYKGIKGIRVNDFQGPIINTAWR